MEIGLVSDMPTYSGGLGVLAGDTIRAAADLKVPLVAVTLLHRKGYFYQRLDSSGRQIEEPVDWAVDDFLTELPQRVSVTIEGRTVVLRAWKYDVAGPADFSVPVYFLDSRSAGKFRVGSHADTLSLRRRSALSAVPGSHSRHRRRADAARHGS